MDNEIQESVALEATNETSQVEQVELPAPKVDSLGRAYATGKRKESIARVWLKAGKGTITVNGQNYTDYFKRATLQSLVVAPLSALEGLKDYDITATVIGGGLSGQAGAVKHGISKALTYYNPALRKSLKPLGYLTRDSRVVESKKYGHRKARRSFQFSKR